MERNGITRFFRLIVGREQVPSLKPSSAGVHDILRRYHQTPSENWVLVGDSWIDGRAAMDAGISFVSYRGDMARMNSKSVCPSHAIQNMTELIGILL